MKKINQKKKIFADNIRDWADAYEKDNWVASFYWHIYIPLWLVGKLAVYLLAFFGLIFLLSNL